MAGLPEGFSFDVEPTNAGYAQLSITQLRLYITHYNIDFRSNSKIKLKNRIKKHFALLTACVGLSQDEGGALREIFDEIEICITEITAMNNAARQLAIGPLVTKFVPARAHLQLLFDTFDHLDAAGR